MSRRTSRRIDLMENWCVLMAAIAVFSHGKIAHGNSFTRAYGREK